MSNVRFLAGYRRDTVVARTLAAAAADAVRDGEQLACAEQRLATDGLVLRVRPALLAALWRGLLRTDLNRRLGGDSVLYKAPR
ncbi:hypothetical protein [Allorhizocola rhizosphaerae]|uniref:hypothetical protein n=1 Tax=Allorhizocola rhizosphaerae TaxID=1872709 RepID=UPI001B8BB86C|nr:hypothetical protein [Allorhizocola rhizosphaerae]